MPPRATTELRLYVTDPDSEKLYDSLDYEEKLFYHNIISRSWEFYPHDFPIGFVYGVDHCFDCALEIHIWREFIRNCRPEVDEDYYDEATADLMNKSSRIIHKDLKLFHHGIDPNVPMFDKVQKLLPELHMYFISKQG